MDTKICARCKEEKSTADFGRCKDGLQPYCKSCQKEYRDLYKERAKQIRKENPDRYNGYNKTYYDKNSDKVKSRTSKYKKENPEVQKKSSKKYREINKEKLNINSRTYNKEHKYRLKEYNAEWRDKNREHYNNRERHRRCLKRGLEGYHTIAELEEIYIEQVGKCVYCKCSLSETYSVDHIIPITREGTSDYAYNIQLLCKSCNSRKNNKTHEEFLLYLEVQSNTNKEDL